jgi:hypothetical protein
MAFAHPLWFLLTLMIPPVLWFAKGRRSTLGHSQVSIHKNVRSMPILGWAPTFFLILFIVGLSVTAAQPQRSELINKHVLARDFVISVDVSSSMTTVLQDPAQKDFAAPSMPQAKTQPDPSVDPELAAYQAIFGYGGDDDESGPPPPKGPTRAMAAREGVKQFLDHREGDRVALLTFDDRVYYSEPLGLNINAVRLKLDDILHSGGGTNFDGPSAGSPNVGAIQGAIRHFRELSTSKTKVFIMVTDGEDSIHPERADELARQMNELHIKMFVIGVGESWKGSTVPDLQKFVERPDMNGLVIRAGDAQQLRDGFAKIDQLERTDTELGGTEVKHELYPVCAELTLVALFCMLLSAMLVKEEV